MISPDIFWGTSGSRKPKILIVGEAWGREEAQSQRPFVGQSGRELFRMLGEALQVNQHLLAEALASRSTHQWLAIRERWLEASGILLTNVVAAQPPGNDFTHFLYDNKTAKSQKEKDYYGIFPKPTLLAGIDRLWHLINTLRPNIIVACGNWPLHILTGHATPKTTKGYKLPTGIGSWRGSQTWCDTSRSTGPVKGQPGVPEPNGSPSPSNPQTLIPLLPVIHPAAILRDWGYRHVTVHDFRARLGRFLRGQLQWEAPPTYDIFRPTLAQVREAFNGWRRRLWMGDELWLGVDLETYARRYITCVGICDGDLALCIPFFYFNERQQHQSYWSLEEEVMIWGWIREILEHLNTRIVGQNFIYDTQYFARMGFVNAQVAGDTMVAHHLLFPGTPKGLEMLASLYNHHYCYWKDESEEWAADELSAEDLWKYNCKDTRSTLEAWRVLYQVIDSQGFWPKYEQRLRQWKLSRHMTLQGVRRDAPLQDRMIQNLYRELTPVESWLTGAVPEAWRFTAEGKPWYTSSQATARILYECAGITPVLHKKTKQPTTDDTAILELCERPDTQWLSPLLTRLRDYRSAMVFLRNFLLARPDPMGRWATQVNIAHPETFRWSSTKNAFDEGSNMQNLPKVED